MNSIEWNEDMFFDYLKRGGFPLRFDYKDEASVHRYLSNLYDSIVNRDIIKSGKSLELLSARDFPCRSHYTKFARNLKYCTKLSPKYQHIYH